MGVRPTIYADARNWENHAALGTSARATSVVITFGGAQELSRPKAGYEPA